MVKIKSAIYSEKLRLLSRQILQIANSGLSRTYFLRKILNLLLEFFKADEIKILFKAFDDASRYELVQYNQETFRYNFFPPANNTKSPENASTELDDHWKYILTGSMAASLSFVTERGSLWIRDLDTQLSDQESLKQINISEYLKAGDFKSLLVIPFLLENERIGLIELMSLNKDF